jgi:hypothetical protein
MVLVLKAYKQVISINICQSEKEVGGMAERKRKAAKKAKREDVSSEDY